MANGITSGFAPAIRLHVKVEWLRWDMLLDHDCWSRMLRGRGLRKVSQTGRGNSEGTSQKTVCV